MALINCPECGKQISDLAISCPNCGYSINAKERIENSIPHNTSNEIQKANTFNNYKNKLLSLMSNHKKATGFIMIGLAIVFVIIIISKFTNSEYKSAVENLSYYKSQYNECMSKSSGFLGSSYKAIADKWKDMIGELNKTIWSTRIISLLLAVADFFLIKFGIKYLKSVQEETKNGTNQLP